MSPDVPDGSVIITPDQMYRETHERYGRIESALSGLRSDVHPMITQVAEHDAYLNQLRQAGLPERFTQAETKVAQLESRWAWALGAGTVVCFIAGLVGAVVPTLIH